MSSVPFPPGYEAVDLVDIGSNLTAEAFDGDLDAVLHRARDAGVRRQILTGSDVEHSSRAAALAGTHHGELWATSGVHPHNAQAAPPDFIAHLRALLSAPGVCAVGETGLDFFRDFSPRSIQEQVFEAQLELAAETGLPLFLHERDTHGRFFEVLKPWIGRVHGVLHCFTGSREDLHQALDAGLHIGVTGWICDERRGDRLRELAPDIPDRALLLETDAPWLLPRTIRPRRKSRRNEPAFLPWVLREVATIRGTSDARLAALTANNAAHLFGLDRDTEVSSAFAETPAPRPA